MTPARIRNQLTAIERMVANLKRDAPAALEAVKLRTAECDGYASTASGADNGPMGTGGASSVERAVERRLGGNGGRSGPVADLEDAEDFLRAAALGLDKVNEILRKYAAGLSDAERQALRCIGDGTPEGANCHRWAERKGMCSACYMRSRRRGVA